MFDLHYKFWPARLPKTLDYPRVPICEWVETSARRYPDKAAIVFYGARISYRRFKREMEQVAGALSALGVQKGDRVALYMQNCPQYIIAYFGILRANAVVVPLNPMLLENELEYMLNDCGAKVVFSGQELGSRVLEVKGRTPVQAVVSATYSEYLDPEPEITPPDFVAAPRQEISGATPWRDFLAGAPAAAELVVGPDDQAVLPYTSGSTGVPKGCVHTHASVTANAVGSVYWLGLAPSAVHLTVLPLFHATGMQHSMNAPVFLGATMVLLSRWDRDAAAKCIQQYKCSHWVNISTMVVDFLANPNLGRYDLSSLVMVGGGGAPLPEVVGERLYQVTGLRYVEGYGLSETISQTHFNPPDRPKLQCLGVPVPDLDCRVIDLETMTALGPGQEGELVVRGPQVMREYWHKPQDTEEAFITINDQKYFKTGDIVRYDEEGYFFIVDRSKRMINAAGFKVWPTEVEGYLYKHPAVQEACVVATPDPKRGENVKAFIVLRPEYQGKVTAEEIIAWSKDKMATYKYPRQVEFIDALPKSGTGKILWKELQDRERTRVGP